MEGKKTICVVKLPLLYRINDSIMKTLVFMLKINDLVIKLFFAMLKIK